MAAGRAVMLFTTDRGQTWHYSSPYNAAGDGYNVVALRQTAAGLRGVAGDLRSNVYYCQGSDCL